jgi:hypothetical protein
MVRNKTTYGTANSRIKRLMVRNKTSNKFICRLILLNSILLTITAYANK